MKECDVACENPMSITVKNKGFKILSGQKVRMIFYLKVKPT